jgi:hypothetical protein
VIACECEYFCARSSGSRQLGPVWWALTHCLRSNAHGTSLAPNDRVLCELFECGRNRLVPIQPSPRRALE